MDHRRAGFTLVEQIAALVVFGIVLSLAVPSLSGTIARAQVAAAMNRFVGDMARARMMALRNGTPVELRLVPGGDCAPTPPRRVAANRYRMIVHGATERVVEEVRVGGFGSGVCIESNNDSTLVFNARGLPEPFENRTVNTRKGEVTTLVTISVLGRVLRRE